VTNKPDAPQTNDQRCPTDHPDERAPFALALEWTSRITTISLELVLPALFGYWLDQRFGTRVLFLILGMMLGFVTALLSLLRLARPSGKDRPAD
jgi:ATP synthase protein I